MLEEIRTLARQFAQDQLRPHVERWDHERALDRGILSELGELGFFGMTVPEAYGGMELDLPTYAAAIEALAWGDPAVALIVARSATVADMLLRHGSETQKRAWLERLASGEATACTTLSERGHGALGEGIRATAVEDGWRLDGATGFVVNGRAAELALVGAEAAAPDIGSAPPLFLVASDSAGYTVGERAATLGFSAVDIVHVALDDVRLDEAAALRIDAFPQRGEVGRGASAVAATSAGSGAGAAAASTDFGRVSIAAIAVGIAQAALDHALDYANQREQFGQKLRAFEGIQLKLADMAVRLQAARALIVEAASSPAPARTAAAKVMASETAMWVSTQAVQVFGGYGYMRDYPVEKLMRDAKGTELLEAANDDLRVLITAEMYRHA